MLRPLHLFFNLLIRLGFWIFYEKSTWHGWEKSKFRGAMIVVVNHPATLMDPLQVAGWLHRYVHFLVNYSMFKNPIAGFILGELWCIPIKRREDVGENMPLQNDKSFAACDDFLRKKGCLLIAPEGSSFAERRIRPLKTGCARIAFSAEKKANWQLGLRITPIGLTYADPIDFRSRVFKNVGAPILVADFRAIFEKDEREAVDLLTALMQQSLQNLTLSTENAEEETNQRRLETIFLNEKIAQNSTDDFLFFKKLWAKSRLDANLSNQTNQYFQNLESANLTDAAVQNYSKTGKNLFDILMLVVGAPLAIFGAILWFLPCGIPYFLTKRLKLYPGYNPTVMFLSGIITVSFFWKFVYELAQHFNLTNWQSMFCVVLTGSIGWCAWQYWRVAKRVFEQLRARHLFAENAPEMVAIQSARQTILNQILTAKTDE